MASSGSIDGSSDDFAVSVSSAISSSSSAPYVFGGPQHAPTHNQQDVNSNQH